MKIRRMQPGVLILLGLCIRLAIAPWFHGFQYDMFIYGNWAQTLVENPLGDFYALAESPDHLPGDLYIHWMLGHVFMAFGGEDFFGPMYRFLLKAFPALVDCLLILIAYRFARDRSNAPAAQQLVFALSLAPALIFITAVWGQWDTVSMAIFLGGLLLLWNKHPRPILAAILFGWALLIKPPLFLLVAPAVIGYAWTIWKAKRPVGTILLSLFGMLSAAVATVTALMYPFGMTWLKAMGDLSLQGQMQVAAELYPHTTLGAANIWMIPLGRPDRVVDTQSLWLFTPQLIGMVLMLGALCVIAYRVIKSSLVMPILVWAMAMVNYAYFLLPTRSHERYLFPAIVMLAILAALSEWQPVISRLFLVSSVVYFFNLVFVYWMPSGILGTLIFEVLSVTHVIVFVMLLIIPASEIRVNRPSPAAEVRTAL